MARTIAHTENDPLGDWWIWYCEDSKLIGPSDIWPGKQRTTRTRKGAFKLRVRVKEVQRFRVNTKYYHVKSFRNPAVIGVETALHFRSKWDAICYARNLVQAHAYPSHAAQNDATC